VPPTDDLHYDAAVVARIRAAELVTARRGLRHSILERADLQTLLIPIKANADG